LPRLTRDSLEGTPGGACQTAQKDVSVSWSRYMVVLLVTQSRRIVACEAQVPRAVFHRSGHPVMVALPEAEAGEPQGQMHRVLVPARYGAEPLKKAAADAVRTRILHLIPRCGAGRERVG
jgi:hypothetical protein